MERLKWCIQSTRKRIKRDKHEVTVYWSPPSDQDGLKPPDMAKKVLDDFKKKEPIEITVDAELTNHEIKLPR